MQRVILSVDDDLLATLDRHMKKHRYASRSEALRDILREVSTREALEAKPVGKEEGFCVAALAYVYDHDSCLEVSVLRGPVKDVRAMADDTVSQRGVRHGQLHLVPAELRHKRHSHGGRGGHDHIHA